MFKAYNKLKYKKGIIVFNDSAGAKACLALAKKLKKKDLLIISDRKYSFYSEFKLEINSITERCVKEWFDFFKPDFVFTGTSMPEKIELEFLKVAKSKKIKTYSFVDHWTNISARFKSFEEYILPDELWLIDEYAKEKAKKEGIDEYIISVTGNPYYDFLKNWTPDISKDIFFNKIGLTKNEKYILYAPAPISSFKLKSKYGQDELDGLKFILKNLKTHLINNNSKIIFKIHPNQDINYIEKFILKLNTVEKSLIIIDKSNFINDLIYYSEMTLGFISNSLIEARLMKKKVGRLLLGNLIDDPIKHLEFDNLIKNPLQLINFYND